MPRPRSAGRPTPSNPELQCAVGIDGTTAGEIVIICNRSNFSHICQFRDTTSLAGPGIGVARDSCQITVLLFFYFIVSNWMGITLNQDLVHTHAEVNLQCGGLSSKEGSNFRTFGIASTNSHLRHLGDCFGFFSHLNLSARGHAWE